MSNSQKKTLFSCIPKRILSLAITGAFLVSGSAFAITNSSLPLPPQGEAGDIITVDYWNAIIDGLQNLDRRTREIYADPNGNVVIGGAEKNSNEYTIPQEQLDIKGAIKIGTTNTQHSGTIRFDSTEKDFEGYTGEEWKSLTKGGNGSGGKCTLADSGVAFTPNIASASCASGSISYSSVEWEGKDGYFPSLGIKSSQTSASINCLGNACKLRLICCDGGAGSGGENDVLAQLNCAEGNVPKWDANLAKWSCGEDSGAGKLPWSELLKNVYRQEGNVGIGTDHPVHKLDVRDDIYMNEEKVATEPWVLGQNFLASFTEIDPQVGENTENFLSKWDGNALVKSEIFENGGNVGIGTGTDNPKRKLEIKGNTDTSENKGLLYLNQNYTGNYGVALAISRKNSDVSALSFGSNTSEDGIIGSNNSDLQIGRFLSGEFTPTMILTNNGEVGIGTNDPQGKLDINGEIVVGNGTSDGAGVTFKSSEHTDYHIDNYEGRFRIFQSGNERFTVDTDGKVGIGTYNPSEKLEIYNGDFVIRKEQKSFDYNYNGGEMTTGDLKISTSVNEWLPSIVDASANIDFMNHRFITMRASDDEETAIRSYKMGIGTYNPTEKLEVNGKVKATAFVYASDRRLKKDIVKIKDPLQKIDQIKGVTFNWRDSGKSDIGVIAQDVEKIFPVAVSTNPETGIKAVDYPRLVPLLVASIQAQQKISQDQELQIQKLEKQIQRLSQ